MRWPLIALLIVPLVCSLGQVVAAQQAPAPTAAQPAAPQPPKPPPAAPPQAAPPQAATPKSRVDILKSLSQKTEQLDNTLEQMKQKHATATTAAEADAVKKLKALAQTETSNGEIAEATETWTDVLEIDPSDVEAKKYFRSIGRLDLIEKTVAAAEAKNDFLPQRRTLWQGESGIVFRRLPDGTWLETWTNKDVRKVHTERSRSPYNIVLFNRTGSSRVLHIIYPDHCYWKHYNDRRWQLGSNGIWSE